MILIEGAIILRSPASRFRSIRRDEILVSRFGAGSPAKGRRKAGAKMFFVHQRDQKDEFSNRSGYKHLQDPRRSPAFRL